MQRCSDCKQDKQEEFFAKNQCTMTGYNGICKACKKVRDKKQYETKGEEIRKHNRKYNQDNKEWLYPNSREWNHIARAKEYNCTEIDEITTEALYKRDKGICGICKDPILDSSRTSIDLIVPFSKGGQYTWNNIQASHIACNIKKGVKDAA